MRGREPFQTELQRGIEDRGFNQIKKILRQIIPQITLYYFREHFFFFFGVRCTLS
mgnify:CR=1 FL=1